MATKDESDELNEQTVEETVEERTPQTFAIINLAKSGYAGVTKEGRIVDRREYPDAIPIQQNELLGVPKPLDPRLCPQCELDGICAEHLLPPITTKPTAECRHERAVDEGDGMCAQGCCDKKRCLDCGKVFLIEGAD